MDVSPRQDSSMPPHGRLGSIRVWLGLFGAPLAWISQFSVSEPLAAHACYPYLAPLSEPLWANLPAKLTAIGLICLAIAVLSGFMVWTLWRDAKTQPSALVSNRERQRFLIQLGALSSFIFIVAILFNLCALWLVPPCSSWF